MAGQMTDTGTIRTILVENPVRDLELLDTLDREPEALGFWADDPQTPGSVMAVRWKAGPLGMTHMVHLLARRIEGLEGLIDALPRGAGTYEITCPFWIAPALEQVFRTELQGPVATYAQGPEAPPPHPAARQTQPLAPEDLDLVAYAFPRAVVGAPHRALVLRDELVAVAVTTAVAEGYARFGVHVVETSRGHGFGGAVARALFADLQAAGLKPTAVVQLADEASVRLVERLGMLQVDAQVKVTGVGRRASENPD